MEDFRPYISINPNIRFGKPCIVGTRISIGDILGWLAADMSFAEILEDLPQLQREHILALHLSHYLHDLGVFLHFQDDPTLHKTVILQNLLLSPVGSSPVISWCATTMLPSNPRDCLTVCSCGCIAIRAMSPARGKAGLSSSTKATNYWPKSLMAARKSSCAPVVWSQRNCLP